MQKRIFADSLNAVDQIGATSLGEVRNEIGLEHELMEVLQNWTGGQVAILSDCQRSSQRPGECGSIESDPCGCELISSPSSIEIQRSIDSF
ncbi:MAG TPA: hypothetical protein VHS34_08435 [Terriglobales bacterium]|jgi:hypothetical protein|nr:hypothetical protein [Terriglobales bacterium]